MSIDGIVACGTCHLIDRQFQDDLPRGRGVGVTNRRTMPLAGVAWSPWFFWDGRRDSLWAQALTPLEDPREHAATRAFYAHFIAENFNERYERIFGPLPISRRCRDMPGRLGTEAEKAAWASMSPEQQEGMNRVFANLGKAIAAFERSIVPEETRFDRFAKALAAGNEARRRRCADERGNRRPEALHRQGQLLDLPHRPALHRRFFPQHRRARRAGLPEDLGRETGAKEVAADPFNCLGKFSDAGPEACGELRFMVKDGPQLTRAYKTPSLRGAATRPPYMHAGQFATLDEVVDHYARAPAAPSGQTELHPLTFPSASGSN